MDIWAIWFFEGRANVAPRLLTEAKNQISKWSRKVEGLKKDLTNNLKPICMA